MKWFLIKNSFDANLTPLEFFNNKLLLFDEDGMIWHHQWGIKKIFWVSMRARERERGWFRWYSIVFLINPPVNRIDYVQPFQGYINFLWKLSENSPPMNAATSTTSIILCYFFSHHSNLNTELNFHSFELIFLLWKKWNNIKIAVQMLGRKVRRKGKNFLWVFSEWNAIKWEN